MKKISVRRLIAFGQDMKDRGFLILVILLVIVTFSSFALIMVNIYTVRILSALRATINASSHFAKAQKDGAHHLLMYVGTRNEAYFKLYKKDLEVFTGDNLALSGLENGGNDNLIAESFLMGHNNPADVQELVWVVRNFQYLEYVQQSITYWTEGNTEIANLDQRANLIHDQILKKKATTIELNAARDEILTVNDYLTVLENNFSDISGEASRTIGRGLLYVNIAMTLLIIGATGLYSAISIRKLLLSQAHVSSQNRHLLETNKELDKFVYSASHDLRAPLTSMKGLVQLIRDESDPLEIARFLTLMDESLDKQDEFIREIIDYSRNKRTELKIREVNMEQLIDEAFAQLQYLKGSAEVNFIKNLEVNKVNSDPLRLRIILNNLISNAIKYSNARNGAHFVTVRTNIMGDKMRIQVIDNGLGIAPKYHEKIFEMFFVTQHSHRGSGVGLYITKESVEKINGSIHVSSEPGRGTTFTVLIPMHDTSEVETDDVVVLGELSIPVLQESV